MLPPQPVPAQPRLPVALRLMPHGLTGLRLLLSLPVLIAALTGRKSLFFLLLFVAFVTEIDGTVARRLGVASDFGRRFDTIADLTVEFAALIGIWMLWPVLIRQELFYFLLGSGALLAEMLLGLVRIGAPFAYHSVLARLTGLLAGLGAVLLFLLHTPLLLRVAAVTQLLVLVEYAAISLLLPAHRGMMSSGWHAWRSRFPTPPPHAPRSPGPALINPE